MSFYSFSVFPQRIDKLSPVTAVRGFEQVDAYHLRVTPFYLTVIRIILIHTAGKTDGLSLPSSRKHTFEATEMVDLLEELVEVVPDPPAGGIVPLNGPRSRQIQVVLRSRRTGGTEEAKEERECRGDDALHDVAQESRGGNWDPDESGWYAGKMVDESEVATLANKEESARTQLPSSHRGGGEEVDVRLEDRNLTGSSAGASAGAGGDGEGSDGEGGGRRGRAQSEEAQKRLAALLKDVKRAAGGDLSGVTV
ncbi:hypothetical protein BJV78DRAFT_1157261 [Lactifluus subvellereus]|nr:hypothetical protein BJV78DRAFT_1157261 [Lactifluus subvellereus]